jgi:hypothetical protein
MNTFSLPRDCSLSKKAQFQESFAVTAAEVGAKKSRTQGWARLETNVQTKD